MRGSDGGEQNLSEVNGPLSEPPFSSEECSLRWKEMKEGEKKDSCPYFLKIDFSFYSEREANGKTGWGIGLKMEGRSFQTQEEMKEVFRDNWQNDENRHDSASFTEKYSHPLTFWHFVTLQSWTSVWNFIIDQHKVANSCQVEGKENLDFNLFIYR